MWIRRASWVDKARTLSKFMPARYTFSWHTKGCVEQTINKYLIYFTWVEKYPFHCRDCLGAGSACWDENQAPLGSGQYWPETFCDPCLCIAPNDIEEMACPRCCNPLYSWIVNRYKLKPEHEWLVEKYGNDGLVEAWLENKEHCPFCLWEHGDGVADIAPQIYQECSCWNSTKLPRGSAIPSGIQEWLFEHFGTIGQRFFRYPIKILRRKAMSENKESVSILMFILFIFGAMLLVTTLSHNMNIITGVLLMAVPIGCYLATRIYEAL